VGNQRFEGVDDFGWKMEINNPSEDTVKPRYVPNSLDLRLSNTTIEGQEVKLLIVTFEIDENQQMAKTSPVYAQVTNPKAGIYRLEKYGSFNPINATARIEFPITEYHASGNYAVSFISMTDQARNKGSQVFSG